MGALRVILGATGKPSTWLPVVKLAELPQSHMNVLVPLILLEFPLYVSNVLGLQIMSFFMEIITT